MRSWFRVAVWLVLGAVVARGTIATAAAAEDSKQAYQTWFNVSAHGPLRKSLWLWADGALRFNVHFQPVLGRVGPGLSWRAHPTVFLTGGYAWVPMWNQAAGSDDTSDLVFVDEHRAWQQFMWMPKDTARGWTATIRVREEQRFRPQSEGGSVGHRLRIMLRAQVPLVRKANVLFVHWNELLIGWNAPGWGQPQGIDQQRLFAGLGWQAIPAVLRLELGYVVQWLPRHGPDTINHAASLSASFGWPEPKRRRR